MSAAGNNPWVDGGASLVRAADAAWPFDLDLRSGTATIELGSTPYRIQPLRWRDKLALARFAHLGPRFVEQQFLRLALPADQAPPRDEPTRALVWTLALWLNDPDGADTLPLDPRRLAAVTRDVCRATGLTPADLDQRDALEVEALWQIGGAQPVDEPSFAAGPAESSGDFTRIVVVPDPAPVLAAVEPAEQEAGRGERPAIEHSPDERASTDRPTPDAEHVAGGARPDPPAAPVVAARSASAPRIQRAEASQRSAVEPRAPAAVKAPRRTGAFRVMYPAAISPTPADEPAIAAASAPTKAPAIPAAHAQTEPQVAAASVSQPPRAVPDSLAPRTIASAGRAADAPVVPGAQQLLERPSMLARPAIPGAAWSPVEPSVPPAPDADTLLDTLSARLQQAAAELGIDVEV